jgi:hypothetical protein
MCRAEAVLVNQTAFVNFHFFTNFILKTQPGAALDEYFYPTVLGITYNRAIQDNLEPRVCAFMRLAEYAYILMRTCRLDQ